MNRRGFLTAAAALAPAALGQKQRDWGSKEPISYLESEVVSLDRKFDKYKLGNTFVQRVWTGALWAEGPAWSGQGRFLVWSDIPNNRQVRWMEEDGHVSTYRASDYSNGNTFDYQGRQISCQHGLRRVCRFEPDGTVTVIADKFNGKPLNSPNDVVVHPDGGIWFTDPPYGILGNYEGFQARQELKEAVYRVDPKTAKIEKITDEMDKPNGICFSPDYKKVYVCDTGDPKDIQVFDVVDGKTARNKRQFISMNIPGKGAGNADGIRADVDGNIWTGAGWVGPGYDGVHIFSPEGQRIGQILLPEICANVCFGGTKRNRLFMCASQSVYAVYVGTRGAHIA